jgi:hypothetical protein
MSSFSMYSCTGVAYTKVVRLYTKQLNKLSLVDYSRQKSTTTDLMAAFYSTLSHNRCDYSRLLLAMQFLMWLKLQRELMPSSSM